MNLLKAIKILTFFSLMIFMLSGCGAHYVATNKNLGLSLDRKPVVGVIVTGFFVNTEGNPMGAILGVKYGEEITQYLKDEGIDAKVVRFSEVQTHDQLAAAIKNYNSIADYRKRVSDGFNFGRMEKDFNELGIDMLVIISGSASNASIPAWVQATTFVAFGAMGLVTPIHSGNSSTDGLQRTPNTSGAAGSGREPWQGQEGRGAGYLVQCERDRTGRGGKARSGRLRCREAGI